ncbi:ABC transporter transmembrane domain-containing protein [Gorillibacterium sp. sgz5001074]|uniref:ABC transporter transmembrane domain-containing protein n=1 Tax=Gorillibacterium sp. sgz5001074 TaxID=3446695 RepID=UPI003F67CB31
MALHPLLCGVFLLSLIVEVAYAVGAPLSLKYLVDAAFVPKDLHAFAIILAVLFGSGLLHIGTSFCGDYSIGKISGGVIRNLRLELYDHLQRQSQSFYHRYRVGDLITRFSSDMGSIERVVRSSFPFFLREALSLLLGLTVLFSLEWRLTLAVLAGSILLFLGPRLLMTRSEAAHAQYKEAQERFTNTVDEMVKGHRTIRILRQQPRFREQGRLHMDELFSLGLNVHAIGSLMERLPQIALLLLNGLLIGLGGYLIFQDMLSVGEFVAFFTLFLNVGQSGSNLSYLIPSLTESGVSFRRIEELLKERSDVPEAAAPVELPSAPPSIRMEHVTFGYNADAPQLHKVSLDIPAGSYAAFVGPSGSGKSTALQLISRFYDPTDGRIAWNGHDVRSISEDSLRRLSTMVTQDAFFFNATLRDNLLLDRVDATEEDMYRAAREANLHDTICSWPAGYDTPVRHEGGSLSGGERQRLSLARALLRNPKLLLLDEVTSALDPAAEADITARIESLRDRATLISVTHRLASAMRADRIYVFEKGRIVESGTHMELLRLNGLYRSLWEKQHGFHLSQDGQYATVDPERLAKLPFFQGIEPDLLQDVSKLLNSETCKEGEAIVTEGDEGHTFYIIVRGRFEVLKEGRRVAVLEDGDHFGEIALLRNIPRTATVKALAPSVLLSMRQEAFQRLTEEHPHLLDALELALQKRL